MMRPMHASEFKLHPFHATPGGSAIAIQGSLSRDGGRLRLAYRLTGALWGVSIAPPATSSERRHELWKETCFECFVQPAGSTAYWELNLSPAGHWNLYRFDAYRRGMREESAIAQTPFAVQREADRMDLVTAFDLDALGIGAAVLAIGLTAVIRAPDGRLDYWALVHPDTKPDFHHPKSFVLAL